MALTVATWSINSVRLRSGLVQHFLRDDAPDILCRQETKSPVEKIPAEDFAALGYGTLIARGEKGYNGVAIIARIPLEPLPHVDFCGNGDARHVAAVTEAGLAIHNLYIPAGGDEPDPASNPKFAHKLDFVAELAAWGRERHGPAVLVGDLNNTYLDLLQPVYPAHRLGPTGDAPKVNCTTCHQGVYKLLFGTPMITKWPELSGPGPAAPAEEKQAMAD